MQTTILDGTGTGISARVTDRNRLLTLAVSEDITAHHTFDGDGYNINTGNISLTSASKSAVMYFKNNEDRDIVITSLVYNLGVSTGGTGNILIQVERNPTGGTIVSNASAATPINRDFGSANTLNCLSYKGAEGYTLTGGTVLFETLASSVGRFVIAVGSIVLRKGNSIGVTITPQTSNTSMTVQVALPMYLANESTQDDRRI